METTITINSKNFLIRSKRDLQNDEFQRILAKSYYGPKQKRIEKIYCSCRKPNGTRVRLYSLKSRKDGKFYVRTYQKQSKFHRFDCPFNSEGIENFISEEDNNIVLSSANILFKLDADKTKNLKRKNYKRKLDEDTERKVLSFNHLIFILMDDSYSISFNILNKGVDRLSGNIKMPSIDDFERVFYRKFLESKFRNGDTIKQVLKKYNATFYMGIINYVDTNFNEDFVILKSDTGEFKVNRRIWEKASRYIKIKKNIVSPPYFYLTIKRDFVVRLFVFPIANKEFFIPVESNVERKYVSTLDKPVYKPLTVAQIKRILTKDTAKNFYKFVEPDVRPDFFIFEKGKITVVEVFHPDNLKDISYKSRLKYKETMYKRLDDIFDYKLVEIS